MKKLLSLVLALVLVFALVIPACAADAYHPVTVYISTYYDGVFAVTFSKAAVETKDVVTYGYNYEEMDAEGAPLLEKWTANSVPVITLANDTTISLEKDGAAPGDDGIYYGSGPVLYGYEVSDGKLVSLDPLGAELYNGITLDWVFANGDMDVAIAFYPINGQETKACYFIREGTEVPSDAFSAAASEAPGVNSDKTVVGVAGEAKPADADLSDWAKAEVEAASAAGLVTDHTASGFKEDITRFQFSELIVNLAEKVTGKEIAPAAADTFTDCNETAVLKAYAAGIVNGVGDNRFAPDTTTNREQIATMIARAIAYIEKETGKSFTPAAASIEKFSDKGEVSAWAAEGVGLLAANGIMNGTSDTTCSPMNPCTVEQSILLVYRFFNRTL